MKIPNPEKLSHKDYFKHYADFLYLRKLDRDFLFETFKDAIRQAFNKNNE